MWTRRTTAVSFMFLFAFMLAAGSASAQSGFGLRAGAGAEPDQFYFGAHMDVKEIVERFWFRPNAELGVGDGLTLFSLNGEFVYDIPIKSSKQWVPYVGGGPAFLIGSFRVPGGGRDSDTGGGFNFLGGIRQRKGFMAEVKLGLIDSPEFKLGVGWTF
ncbi:MAG TPA: hypothetical protein VFR05_02995 [Terriglobia bacterium]|nr:hypothetical protein [Terriglobia bacterium]